MSTAFSYLPGLNGSMAFDRPAAERLARIDKARRVLLAQLPTAFARRIEGRRKSPLKIAYGRDDMPAAARMRSHSVVFARLVTWAEGRLWADASGVRHPEGLRAALLSAAGIAAFCTDSRVRSLGMQVEACLNEKASDAVSRDNLWRRARARSIMAQLSPLEALVEETFIALGGSWAVMRKLFGPTERRDGRLRRAISRARPDAPIDALAGRALRLAWSNLLNFPHQRNRIRLDESGRTAEDACTQAAPKAAFVKDTIDYGRPGIPLHDLSSLWPGDHRWVSKRRRLYPFGRLASLSPFETGRYLYDPLSYNLGPGDFAESALRGPSYSENFGAVSTLGDIALARRHVPFGGIMLQAIHAARSRRSGDGHADPYATLYVPVITSHGNPLRATLPPIPAVRCLDPLQKVRILSARTTTNPAVAAFLLTTEKFGRVRALCTSWMDQCERLQTATEYRASVTFWTVAAERCCAGRVERCGTGVKAADDGFALSQLVVYVAGRGHGTRLAGGTMQVLEGRLAKEARDPDIMIAMPGVMCDKLNAKSGEPLVLLGYFLCEGFIHPAAWFTFTGGESGQIPNCFLPPDVRATVDPLLHLLPEKPLALDEEEAREILADEERNRRRQENYRRQRNTTDGEAAGTGTDAAASGSGDASGDVEPVEPDEEQTELPAGPEPALSLAMRSKRPAEVVSAAFDGDVASLCCLFIERALGNEVLRRPELAVIAGLLDRTAAYALGCGAEGAFEVISGFGARGRLIGKDLRARAVDWFSEHGRSGRGVINSAAGLLAAARTRALTPRELERLLAIGTQAAIACGDPRAGVLLARVLDVGRQRYLALQNAPRTAGSAAADNDLRTLARLANPDADTALAMLRSMTMNERTQLAGLYVLTCYQIFGAGLWTSTFRERLEAIVERAAAGRTHDLFLLFVMLEVEGGFFSSSIEEFCVRPGVMPDDTRPDARTIALAAMKLRRWYADKTHDARRTRSLSLQLMSDWRWLGSRRQVTDAINRFDLWGFLGRELRLSSTKLLDHARILEGAGTGRYAFWATMAAESYHELSRQSGVRETAPQGFDPELKTRAQTSLNSQAAFICRHSTPFIPDLPSVREAEFTWENLLVMRYDALESPLERSALLLTMSTAQEADEETGRMPLPPSYPYFSSSSRARAMLLELFTDEAKTSACLAVNLLHHEEQSPLRLVFFDIFSACLQNEYQGLAECTICFYMVGALRLHETDAAPELMPRWLGYGNEHVASYLVCGGRIRSRETDWTTIAGISFDRYEIEVSELEGFAKDGILVFYQPAFLREEDSPVGRTTWLSGVVYGYVEEFDLAASRNMKLN